MGNIFKWFFCNHFQVAKFAKIRTSPLSRRQYLKPEMTEEIFCRLRYSRTSLICFEKTARKKTLPGKVYDPNLLFSCMHAYVHTHTQKAIPSSKICKNKQFCDGVAFLTLSQNETSLHGTRTMAKWDGTGLGWNVKPKLPKRWQNLIKQPELNQCRERNKEMPDSFTYYYHYYSFVCPSLELPLRTLAIGSFNPPNNASECLLELPRVTHNHASTLEMHAKQ